MKRNELEEAYHKLLLMAQRSVRYWKSSPNVRGYDPQYRKGQHDAAWHLVRVLRRHEKLARRGGG